MIFKTKYNDYDKFLEQYIINELFNYSNLY